jgi:hypothetical protein
LEAVEGCGYQGGCGGLWVLGRLWRAVGIREAVEGCGYQGGCGGLWVLGRLWRAVTEKIAACLLML